MTDESVFRLIVIVNIALTLPIGLYRRIRSQATREKLARKKEGIFIMIGLRLCGLLGWIAITAYLINPAWMAWSSSPCRLGCGGSVRFSRCLRSPRSCFGPSEAWGRPHGYRCHQARTFAGHPRTLSVGSAPVLRCGFPLGTLREFAHRQLAHGSPGVLGVYDDGSPHSNRGEETHREIRGGISGLLVERGNSFRI